MTKRVALVVQIIIAAIVVAVLVAPPVSSLKLKNNTCEIIAFIPFTDTREGLAGDHEDSSKDWYGYGNWPNYETLAKAGYSLMAAAELAKRHFNERNDVIVSDLKDLTLGCDVNLSNPKKTQGGGYFDSGYDRHRVMRQLVEVKSVEVRDGGDAADALCAVVGPVEDYAVEGVAALTETMHIPHLSFASVSQRLTRRDIYPDLLRAIPSVNDIAARLARYVQRDIWRRDYVGIIYDETEFGEQYVIALEDLEAEVGYELVQEHYIEGRNNTVRHAVDEIAESGYKTVILITDRGAVLEYIAHLADERGLLDGVFWILSGHAITPAFLQSAKHKTGTPMDKLLRGAAVFANHDPFMYYGESDPFLSAWRKQDSAFVEELNSLQPRHVLSGEPHFVAPPDYFQEETPAEYASFLYDSVMATGIGACKAVLNVFASHYDEVLGVEFTGASGPFRFRHDDEECEFTSGRHSSDVDFGIYNVRAATATDEEDMTRYEAVLTSIYSDQNDYVDASGGRHPGAWVSVEGTKFIFSDGSSDEPLPKRTVSDHHYLSPGIRTAGFFLVALSLFVSFSAALWIFYARNDNLVKVSQPEFLWMLCLGAALVGSSVTFLSFDEGMGWSQAQLDHACSAFPWFFVVGYLTMYCALFCKLWRISRLMQMRRQKVTIYQVALPFVVIISCSVLVLVVWQIVDPLSWVVDVISLDPLETFGECRSAKHGMIAFIVPLGLLFATIMIFTGVFAWRLRDMQAELSESKWIFFGIVTHLQTWAVGIPIIAITDHVSKDAFYIMLAALGFIFSTSLVVLVIWPKSYSWVCLKTAPPTMRKSQSVQISVNSTGTTRVTGLAPAKTADEAHQSPFVTSESRGVHEGSETEAEEQSKEKTASLERQLAILSDRVKYYEEKEAKAKGAEEKQEETHCSEESHVRFAKAESAQQSTSYPESAPPTKPVQASQDAQLLGHQILGKGEVNNTSATAGDSKKTEIECFV